MAPKLKDPWTVLSEMLAPAIAAFTEYFRLLSEMTPLIKRIAEAQEKNEGMELSNDDVKTLCLILRGLSDNQKKV